jgi:hypothetical protein
MPTDEEIIKALGGPAKVAELLGYESDGGTQRVHNWIERGIPAKVKVDNPHIFLTHLMVESKDAEASATT